MVLARNVTNGPILTSWGTTTLSGVQIADNDTNYRGVLTSMDSLVLEDSTVTGNAGADGVVALYEPGVFTASNVTFSDNSGCLVAGNGTCLTKTAASDLDCDATGCGR